MNELLPKKEHECQITDAATVGELARTLLQPLSHPRYTRQTTHYVVYKAEVPKVGSTKSAYLKLENTPL